MHQEVENAKNDNINQEFKENLNHMHCNDNYSTYPFYTEHNNIKSFPHSYTASHISETRIFTVDDKLRIQKKLKKLEIILKRGYTKSMVFERIMLLKKQCYSEQSDEPIKRYVEKKNLGYLWSD